MKYTIQGETLPVVICELQAGEKAEWLGCHQT